MKEVKDQIRKSILVKEAVITHLLPHIEEAHTKVHSALKEGKKVLLAGNGGSASQASHIAAEFTGRYQLERASLPAIALTCDTSALTSISNDYGYDYVFERQIEGIGSKGDVFIAISTSGNSKNLINAMQKARKMGLTVIGVLGKGGGKMKECSDVTITVPSDDTPRIQESHIMILHIICDIVERRLFG